MKWLHSTLMVGSVLVGVSSSRSQTTFKSLTTFNRDAGSWGSVFGGYHANGAPIDKRFTFMIQYDYRFVDPWGVTVAIQWWNTRRSSAEQSNPVEWYSSSGSLMGGFVLRYPTRYVTPFAQCGVGSGMMQAIVIFYYAVGLEATITDPVHLAVQVRRTSIQEDSFFFMLGLAVKL